jgi:beta-carotene/zeaxanthin 4-ketolase
VDWDAVLRANLHTCSPGNHAKFNEQIAQTLFKLQLTLLRWKLTSAMALLRENTERRAGRAAFLRQSVVGVALAAAVIGAWISIHIGAIYNVAPFDYSAFSIAATILLQSWLTVGLFIVAHDCMHGSLAPGRRTLNRAVGQFCLGIYGAFSYDALRTEHFKHHRHSGTAEDPDFDENNPAHFLPWLVTFMRGYSTWRQPAFFAAGAIIHVAAFGAEPWRVALFWMVPALVSAVQLFYFGTYLPHRVEAVAFADSHNSRSAPWPWIATLLTCFHFGRHHEHHSAPNVPWWQLPRVTLSNDALDS